MPYVFTEQGISMLSSVLRSEVAVNVSIGIMRIFVEMRKYMANSSLLYNRMNAIEERQITYQNETNERVYHIGASLKDAGKKCFAISLLNDSGVIHGILQRLNITEKENKN